MKLRAQFWIKHRGRVDVLLGFGSVSADMVARAAIQEALDKFNAKWPAARREELVCVGIEDQDTGRVIHSKELRPRGGMTK